MNRIISKSLFYIQKWLLGIFVYFDRRIYMRFYNNLLKQHGVKLNGQPRFIAKSVKFDDFDRIILGDRLVVSMNVHFLTHDYSYTTALIAIDKKPTTDKAVINEIMIGNNVFIGMNTTILPGTRIGDNVIVGAGSVLRGVVPENSIVIGNPAEVVGDIRNYAQKMMERNDVTIVIDKK